MKQVCCGESEKSKSKGEISLIGGIWFGVDEKVCVKNRRNKNNGGGKSKSIIQNRDAT